MYFSDYFSVDRDTIESYGALDISQKNNAAIWHLVSYVICVIRRKMWSLT